MTDSQRELYELITNGVWLKAAQKVQKLSMYQFVLQHGWWYEPIHLPSGIERGKQQECYRNAQRLIQKDKSLIYCEGFALLKNGCGSTLHAWVTDGSGNAIDTTWPRPGIAYAGVPFDTTFVIMTCLKNRANMSLLDDWQNGFPLLNGLGDRPEEWLELEHGNGIARIEHPE
jgi:hypothetical protein